MTTNYPNQLSINLNQLVQQSPPLALMETPTLMETLSHENTHAHAPPVIIAPHQCFYLSPFDINGKGYLSFGVSPPY
jgi:hypothetical protein